MEEKIKKICTEKCIDPAWLTGDELRQLESEITAKERGELILDSVLDNPDIRYRKYDRDKV